MVNKLDSDGHALPEGIVVSGNRFNDVGPYALRVWHSDYGVWSQIMPQDFPPNGTKEQEEAFLIAAFGEVECHMQGFNFMKQIWYTIAEWNLKARLPRFIYDWFQSPANQALLNDPDMIHRIISPTATLTTLFTREEFDMYHNTFLSHALGAIQWHLVNPQYYPGMYGPEPINNQAGPSGPPANEEHAPNFFDGKKKKKKNKKASGSSPARDSSGQIGDSKVKTAAVEEGPMSERAAKDDTTPTATQEAAGQTGSTKESVPAAQAATAALVTQDNTIPSVTTVEPDGQNRNLESAQAVVAEGVLVKPTIEDESNELPAMQVSADQDDVSKEISVSQSETVIGTSENLAVSSATSEPTDTTDKPKDIQPPSVPSTPLGTNENPDKAQDATITSSDPTDKISEKLLIGNEAPPSTDHSQQPCEGQKSEKKHSGAQSTNVNNMPTKAPNALNPNYNPVLPSVPVQIQTAPHTQFSGQSRVPSNGRWIGPMANVQPSPQAMTQAPQYLNPNEAGRFQYVGQPTYIAYPPPDGRMLMPTQAHYRNDAPQSHMQWHDPQMHERVNQRPYYANQPRPDFDAADSNKHHRYDRPRGNGSLLGRGSHRGRTGSGSSQPAGANFADKRSGSYHTASGDHNAHQYMGVAPLPGHQQGATQRGGYRTGPVLQYQPRVENEYPGGHGFVPMGAQYDSRLGYGTHAQTSAGGQGGLFNPQPESQQHQAHQQPYRTHGHRSTPPVPKCKAHCSGDRIDEDCTTATKLIVFGIPTNTTESDSFDFFSQFGAVQKVYRIPLKTYQTEAQQCIFVEFRNVHAARACLSFTGEPWREIMFRAQVAKEHWDPGHGRYHRTGQFDGRDAKNPETGSASSNLQGEVVSETSKPMESESTSEKVASNTPQLPKPVSADGQSPVSTENTKTSSNASTPTKNKARLWGKRIRKGNKLLVDATAKAIEDSNNQRLSSDLSARSQTASAPVGPLHEDTRAQSSTEPDVTQEPFELGTQSETIDDVQREGDKASVTASEPVPVSQAIEYKNPDTASIDVTSSFDPGSVADRLQQASQVDSDGKHGPESDGADHSIPATQETPVVKLPGQNIGVAIGGPDGQPSAQTQIASQDVASDGADEAPIPTALDEKAQAAAGAEASEENSTIKAKPTIEFAAAPEVSGKKSVAGEIPHIEVGDHRSNSKSSPGTPGEFVTAPNTPAVPGAASTVPKETTEGKKEKTKGPAHTESLNPFGGKKAKKVKPAKSKDTVRGVNSKAERSSSQKLPAANKSVTEASESLATSGAESSGRTEAKFNAQIANAVKSIGKASDLQRRASQPDASKSKGVLGNIGDMVHRQSSAKESEAGGAAEKPTDSVASESAKQEVESEIVKGSEEMVAPLNKVPSGSTEDKTAEIHESSLVLASTHDIPATSDDVLATGLSIATAESAVDPHLQQGGDGAQLASLSKKKKKKPKKKKKKADTTKPPPETTDSGAGSSNTLPPTTKGTKTSGLDSASETSVETIDTPPRGKGQSIPKEPDSTGHYSPEEVDHLTRLVEVPLLRRRHRGRGGDGHSDPDPDDVNDHFRVEALLVDGDLPAGVRKQVIFLVRDVKVGELEVIVVRTFADGTEEATEQVFVRQLMSPSPEAHGAVAEEDAGQDIDTDGKDAAEEQEGD